MQLLSDLGQGVCFVNVNFLKMEKNLLDRWQNETTKSNENQQQSIFFISGTSACLFKIKWDGMNQSVSQYQIYPVFWQNSGKATDLNLFISKTAPIYLN